MTLVVPGLRRLLTLSGASDRLPALEVLLARASAVDLAFDGPLAAMRLAVPELASEDALTAGPLACLADTGTRPDDWCARLDPVCLTAASDHLRLVAAQGLDITAAEAQAFVQALNALFSDDGLRVQAVTPSRWYLRGSRDLDARTRATDWVAGRNIFDFMPGGPDGPELRRLMTEAQMILHGLPANAAREQAGRPPVNSVWPWGGGRLPAAGKRIELPALWSGEPVVQGLWRHFAGSRHALPDTACDVLAVSSVEERAVVYLSAPLDAFLAGDPGAAAHALDSLERHWARPLVAALRTRRLRSLCVLAGGRSFSVSRFALARFWRRPAPLRDSLLDFPNA